MTLSGREAPSTKRIDVEANLLQDWLLERRQMRKEIQLRVIGVVGVLMLSGIFVSWLGSVKHDLGVRQRPLELRLKALNGQLTELTPTEAPGASSADIAKMAETTKKYGDAYIGQLVSLMNSTTSSMAFSSLKEDVLGGEVKMSGQADAENYFAANEFIQRNNDPSKNMNAVLVSTSRSDVLADDGVSFQFVKKVKVTQ